MYPKQRPTSGIYVWNVKEGAIASENIWARTYDCICQIFSLLFRNISEAAYLTQDKGGSECWFQVICRYELIFFPFILSGTKFEIK